MRPLRKPEPVWGLEQGKEKIHHLNLGFLLELGMGGGEEDRGVYIKDCHIPGP